MTSATTEPAKGTDRLRGEGHGLIVFASVLLVIVGCFNLIYGIAAIANSHVFTAHAHYVFGDLRTWGWITLIIGVLQLLAAAGVVAGNQAARWFGVAVLGLSAIDQMFFIPAYPFWSLMIIAVDVVALYGLCAYGSRANLAPSLCGALTRSRLAPMVSGGPAMAGGGGQIQVRERPPWRSDLPRQSIGAYPEHGNKAGAIAASEVLLLPSLGDDPSA